MVEPISCVIPKISIHNNRPVTTSVAIANFFGKQHKNVLQKIRALDCSPTFMTLTFQPSQYPQRLALTNAKQKPTKSPKTASFSW